MISTIRSGLLVATLLVCGASAASEGNEVAPAAVKFAYSNELFRPWSFDTGWLPETGGPIQVRFQGDLGGGLSAYAPGAVHLGLQPQKLWLQGEPMGGWLSMNMGVELHASMRLNLELAPGVHFSWEGPIPAVPDFDYRFAGTNAFTPFLLDGQEQGSVEVSDSIQNTELFSVPLTAAIIPLPGIGGTLDVSAGGLLNVAMRGSRVAFPEGDIIQTQSSVDWLTPVGQVFQTRARYETNVDYTPALLLVPAVTIHVGPAEWELASFEVPVDLPPLSDHWIFNEESLSFTLPGSPPQPEPQPETGGPAPQEPRPEVLPFSAGGCASAPGSASLLALVAVSALRLSRRRRAA